MAQLMNNVLNPFRISCATSTLILLLSVACSNQAPIAQPLVTVKLKNGDAVAEKSNGDSGQTGNGMDSNKQATAALNSADLSSELLNHISAATDVSVAPISSLNIPLNASKEKCRFVVASSNLNEALKKEAESRGWLSTDKPNFFKLKVDDGTRTFQQCKCLAESVTAAAGVVTIPIMNP